MIPKRYENAQWTDLPIKIQEIALKAIRENTGLYLHGGVGTGKTHMAYGIAQKYRQERPQARRGAIIWNTAELLREIRMDFNRDAYEQLRAEEQIMKYNDLVILDDVGSEKITDWVAEVFYIIINKRYTNSLPTMYTSNLPISDLADRIGDRTASRIVETCEIVELVGPDRRITNKPKIKIEL